MRNKPSQYEVSKVPLNPSDKRGKTREKIPLIFFPCQGSWGFRGLAVHWECLSNPKIYHN